MQTILLIVGIIMIAATAAPLARADSWWIRIFDFPRAQITVISALVLAAYPFVNKSMGWTDDLFVATLLLALFYQAYMMFPYTRLAKPQVEKSRQPLGDTSLSLLFANVLETNRNSAGLLQVIRDAGPDVILAAEIDEWWDGELEPLAADYPYSIRQPQNNTYGLVLYSRLELVDPEIRFLVQDDIPSFFTGLRLRSGTEIQLRCLHPRPPFPTESELATHRDAEILIVGRETKIKEEPFIVFGDLNDVAWSRTNYLFQDISGLLDPRIGRGFFNTFHAQIPLIRFPLDHFFHSNHFRLVDFRRLPAFGSDHFPVYLKLNYEPDAVQTQERLEAEPEQVSEAIDKIKAAL